MELLYVATGRKLGGDGQAFPFPITERHRVYFLPVIDDEDEENEREHPEMFGQDSDVEQEKSDETPVEEQEEEEEDF